MTHAHFHPRLDSVENGHSIWAEHDDSPTDEEVDQALLTLLRLDPFHNADDLSRFTERLAKYDEGERGHRALHHILAVIDQMHEDAASGHWHHTTHAVTHVTQRMSEETGVAVDIVRADYDRWMVQSAARKRPTVSGAGARDHVCRLEDGEPVYLHLEVMGLPRGTSPSAVLHVNGDKLDNRRSNLRVADEQQ